MWLPAAIICVCFSFVSCLPLVDETTPRQPWTSAALPVVIWHGLGDSFQNPGLKELADEITSTYNVSVHLIHMADTGAADQRATFFGRAHEQVATAAAQIKGNPDLAQGFDAVGFSQGGQLLRALAEYHPSPPMRNLVTVGSQHMGISDFPDCAPTDFFCKAAKWALRTGAWQVQDKVIPAQYYRQQSSISEYLQNSAFLRQVNNERWGDKQIGGSEHYLDDHKYESGDRSPRNKTLKDNFTDLHKFIMIGFSDDKTVVPWTSSYFTLINPNTSRPIKHSELPLYAEDYIGLRTLDERGAVAMHECKGEHMQIDSDCWTFVMSWLGPQDTHSRGPTAHFVVQRAD